MNQDTQDNTKIGILINNLGSPDSFQPKSVRRYLKEFLSDPRIIETPKILWWPILNLIILNTRPKKSAAAYESIWTKAGSPLITISQDLVVKLGQKNWSRHVEFALAMRYGNPSIKSALQELQNKGCTKILVLPLYPQYSATTTASTFDKLTSELRQVRALPELRFINQYYNESVYIEAICQSIRQHWQQYGKADKLILSFHGIPQEYVDRGDPYQQQCLATGAAIAEQLELQDKQWMTTFQSRLGPKKWLQPYTNVTLKKLAKKRVESVQLVCPGFSIDCLETLEENDEENKDIFLQAGGKHFETISCLNDSDLHIAMLQSIIEKHIHNW